MTADSKNGWAIGQQLGPVVVSIFCERQTRGKRFQLNMDLTIHEQSNTPGRRLRNNDD